MGVIETPGFNLPAGAGGMDKSIAAKIDAHMGICPPAFVKKQKVAGLHVFAGWEGDFPERLRAVRNVQARSQITVLHEAAAIEARRTIALVFVGPADHGDCGEGGFLTDGCIDMFGFLADIGDVAGGGDSGCRGACGENAYSERNSEINE